VRPPPTVWQGHDHFRECSVFGPFLTISGRSLCLDAPVDPELNLAMGNFYRPPWHAAHFACDYYSFQA
jgi:hypothetical protein